MTNRELLENGLVLRTIETEADIRRYVDFNTEFNNPKEGLNTGCLIRHFPGATFADYQLIEDPRTGEIVSTTCLIPWVIRYEGIPLRAGQLEQVLSHPGYRRLGLVRTQMKRFQQIVRDRGLDISFIWGIPYYYRQYGYSYCIDGGAAEVIPVARIPGAADGQTCPFTLRPATNADAELLARLYREGMQHQQVHLERSADHWRYLLTWAKMPVFVVENSATGQHAGYVGVSHPSSGSRASIVESAVDHQDAALGVLQALKPMTSGDLSIAWPRNGALARLAKLLGSLTVAGEQWLLQITDPAAFLLKIGPALEQRLANSDCAGITRSLTINLFRQAYRLAFQDGRLVGVEVLGFVDSSMGADGGDLCIPPDAFVRLAFGFRGLAELFDAWPDITIKVKSRRLVEVLFPRLESYFYATYMVFDSA